MKLISHRGNLDGPNPEKENNPDYLWKAIEAGFDVEVDVWHDDNKWWFGHDKPQYEAPFLLFNDFESNIWYHAKNIKALERMVHGVAMHYWNPAGFFWHQNDDFTLTSSGYIWTYPGKPLTSRSIAVLPESLGLQLEGLGDVAGVCSDYIKSYK